MKKRPISRQARAVIVTGILCVVVTLLIMQLWLLTATMNAYLGGQAAIVWPAAFASMACFGLTAGLLLYLNGLDR
jgi:F0F1-type ATP synthase assembly protein I